MMTKLRNIEVSLINNTTGTVVLFQETIIGERKSYVLRCGSKAVWYNTADELNNLYLRYRKAGWLTPAELEKTDKAAAPAKPVKPHWDFGPDGFNRSDYDKIASENGWTWCDPRGRIHVQKKRREDIYRLMGGQYVD